jgi:hypothetical protein
MGTLDDITRMKTRERDFERESKHSLSASGQRASNTTIYFIIYYFYIIYLYNHYPMAPMFRSSKARVAEKTVS